MEVCFEELLTIAKDHFNPDFIPQTNKYAYTYIHIYINVLPHAGKATPHTRIVTHTLIYKVKITNK